MSEHKIHCNWNGNMQFTASDSDGNEVIMDIGEDADGKKLGFSPMPMILVGLSGCMGIDVKIIVDKMQIILNKFELEVSGELDEDTSPRIYKKIIINFYFFGKNLDKKKLEKAIKMAEEKYCNVSAILSKSAILEYNAVLIEE